MTELTELHPNAVGLKLYRIDSKERLPACETVVFKNGGAQLTLFFAALLLAVGLKLKARSKTTTLTFMSVSVNGNKLLLLMQNPTARSRITGCAVRSNRSLTYDRPQRARYGAAE